MSELFRQAELILHSLALQLECLSTLLLKVLKGFGGCWSLLPNNK